MHPHASTPYPPVNPGSVRTSPDPRFAIEHADLCGICGDVYFHDDRHFAICEDCNRQLDAYYAQGGE